MRLSSAIHIRGMSSDSRSLINVRDICEDRMRPPHLSKCIDEHESEFMMKRHDLRAKKITCVREA